MKRSALRDKTTRLNARIRERGATALEAAIIISVVVVPLVAVVDSVQEKQADNVETSADRIGYPTEAGSLSTTPTTTGSSASTTPTTASTGPIDTYLTMNWTSAAQGASWTGTLIIDVADLSGTSQSNGTIDGLWTLDDGSTQTVVCSIDTSGQCTMTIKIKKTLSTTATFSIVSMTSDDLTLAAGEELQTVVVAAP